MKKLLSLLMLLCLALTVAPAALAEEVVNVYNWEDYIAPEVLTLFTEETGIKVNYLTFDSNESMYTKLKTGGTTFDVIIPSDYIIAKLISEDMLEPLDFSNLPNNEYIDEAFRNQAYDPENTYSVPYTWGTVGLIYNKNYVSDEDAESWSCLWNSKYQGKLLMFDNPRDAFMTAQMILGQDLNTTNKADWDAAAELLKKGKNNLQDYVMDEVFSKMETGEASIAPYYAGDCLTMMDVNKDLKFFYPEEGTNIFVDSICIPKNAKNVEAALMYINFLLEPDVATANAECLGYASPNTAVVNNKDYCYYQNEVLYPAETAMPKVQYYHDIDTDTRTYYEKLWSEVKLH